MSSFSRCLVATIWLSVPFSMSSAQILDEGTDGRSTQPHPYRLNSGDVSPEYYDDYYDEFYYEDDVYYDRYYDYYDDAAVEGNNYGGDYYDYGIDDAQGLDFRDNAATPDLPHSPAFILSEYRTRPAIGRPSYYTSDWDQSAFDGWYDRNAPESMGATYPSF